MGQSFNLFRFGVGTGGRLFEDEVDVARRALFGDLQMAVVFDEGPHDIGFDFVEHLLVIGIEEVVGHTGLLGFGDQFGVGFGDTDERGRFPFEHSVQVAPNVGMDQANDGDFIGGLLARRKRQGEQAKYDELKKGKSRHPKGIISESFAKIGKFFYVET